MAKITSKVQIGGKLLPQIPKITAPVVTIPEHIKGLKKGLGNVSAKEEIANFISQNQNIKEKSHGAVPAGLLVDQAVFFNNLPLAGGGITEENIKSHRAPVSALAQAIMTTHGNDKTNLDTLAVLNKMTKGDLI